ncbi:prepilin-type N-terminal cleavage/methylation domain-containing protein [Thalassovita sp.]|jgi:general secretion pathway protein I|uniref:prepilin-type N-terminal cleavage/methylation domain-containing protein n=1 Tax=Thalassovita sp. TaxID=1979401 RepID=UPI003B598D6E
MPRLTRRDRGLTLLELIVAVAVLSIGSLAALRSTDQARLAIGNELPRLLADISARNRTQELQLLGPYAALPDTVVQGGMQITLSQTRKTTQAGLVMTTVTAKSELGPGASLVAYLPPGLPGGLQ